MTENGKQVPDVNKDYDSDRNDDDDDVVMDADDDSHSGSETEEIEKNNTSYISKVSEKKIKERPSDQWSKLFIGQKFRLGCEFTLDEWEFDEKF